MSISLKSVLVYVAAIAVGGSAYIQSSTTENLGGAVGDEGAGTEGLVELNGFATEIIINERTKHAVTAKIEYVAALGVQAQRCADALVDVDPKWDPKDTDMMEIKTNVPVCVSTTTNGLFQFSPRADDGVPDDSVAVLVLNDWIQAGDVGPFWSDPKYDGIYAHYSQLLWKETTQLGCAVSKKVNAAKQKFFVCLFNPPGNKVMGGSSMYFLDNVGKP